MIAKNLEGNVIRFDGVSHNNKLCVHRFKSRFGNLSIANAFVPTVVSEDGMKDES